MPLGAIDEMDVLAFVVFDALDQPLLHPDMTNKKWLILQERRREKRSSRRPTSRSRRSAPSAPSGSIRSRQKQLDSPVERSVTRR